MIGVVVTWGVYSTLLKKKQFTLPLLTLVHIVCTFGLISVFPQFLYEYTNGQLIKFDINIVYTLIFLALKISAVKSRGKPKVSYNLKAAGPGKVLFLTFSNMTVKPFSHLGMDTPAVDAALQKLAWTLERNAFLYEYSYCLHFKP